MTTTCLYSSISHPFWLGLGFVSCGKVLDPILGCPWQSFSLNPIHISIVQNPQLAIEHLNDDTEYRLATCFLKPVVFISFFFFLR